MRYPKTTILNGKAYTTCDECGAYEYPKVAEAAYKEFGEYLCVHCAEAKDGR